MLSFAKFFEEVHGFSPYPWQQRMAQMCEAGSPPDSLVVPTGAGKTAMIDVLIWALATQAERSASERTIGVRTVWAIDRRILVDEVHSHVVELSHRLESALDDTSDPLHGPAESLMKLAAGDDWGIVAVNQLRDRGVKPLVATRWRGGLGVHGSLSAPFQPEIITSTISQIGSRLLFRGYGVAQGSLSLNVGLASSDVNICVDEAHIAAPFVETLAAIRTQRNSHNGDLALPPLNSTVITATPQRSVGSRSIELDGDDFKNASLHKRLIAVKTATLREVEGRDEKAIVDAATELIEAGKGTTACIVNRVATARSVYNKLSRVFPESSGVSVALLMGPQRQVDRRQVLDGDCARLFGRDRADGLKGAGQLVLVATQTIEVGLDISVDAMVTQSASTSALVQRFGRLNRDASSPSGGQAIVVRDANSWLYAEDEETAWGWLNGRTNSQGEIDISVQALLEDESRPTNVSTDRAPQLTGSVVGQLIQTAPRPHKLADPDIDVFLNGIGTERSADVELIWRCDLRLDNFEGPDESGDEYRKDLIASAPPRRQEMLTMSVPAAKTLLSSRDAGKSGRGSLDEADIEGINPKPKVASAQPSKNFAIVVKRGAEVFTCVGGRNRSEEMHAGRIHFSNIQPGDQLILPTSGGGVDESGLNPDSKNATDVSGPRDAVADEFSDQEDARLAVPIRLSAQVIEHFCSTTTKLARELFQPVARMLWELMNRDGGLLVEHLTLDDVTGLAGSLRGDGLASSLGLLPDAIAAKGRRWRLVLLTPLDADVPGSPNDSPKVSDLESTAWVLIPLPPDNDIRTADRFERREAPPTIGEHALAVAARVNSYARSAGLSPEITKALVLAARVHDHGKADPRVQDFFAGGSASPGDELRAKSVFGTDDIIAARDARRASGMPRGLRHEIASVAILDAALTDDGIPTELSGADSQLALHLVGTHHGRGRPLPALPILDGHERLASEFNVDAAGIKGGARGDGIDGWSDGDWFERFFAIADRFGPWTMSYLEALLMLADRTISGEGK